MAKDKILQRRAFIKSSSAGLGGALLAGCATKAGIKTENEPEKPKVIQRTLGKTGIRLPVISMGVMNADNPSLVKAALDSGITHLDTAYVYQRGRNEEMVGQVIKDLPRDSYIVATKIPGFPRARRGQPAPKMDNASLRKDFLEKFDVSMKRLGLDYVDILYLHNVSNAKLVSNPAILKVLQDIKAQGRTKYIAISSHSNEPAVIRAAIATGVYEVVLTSYNFKQSHIADLRKAVAEAAAAGLGVVGMKCLAGAFFDREKTKPIDPKAALKWVLQDPNVHTTIPGFTTFDQLSDDVSLMGDITLTDAEKAHLKEGTQLAGMFCQGCETCLTGCQKNLPIPDLMRSYMYAYSYRNLLKARDLVQSLDLPANPCQGCTSCSVNCLQGFAVDKKIKEILPIRTVPETFLV